MELEIANPACSSADGNVVVAEEIKGPMCHFRPMAYCFSDDEQWFECRICGHTKDAIA
jgi:hypothetical protein